MPRSGHGGRWWIALAAVAITSPVHGGSEAVGTYRLKGMADVDAGPALDRSVEVHADAVVTPGADPGRVTVMIGAEGGRCELTAWVDGAGTLDFQRDQRCAVEIRSPERRGHLDGVLRSGRGTLHQDRLELDLSFDFDGTVASTWTPQVPVRGQARATAEGRRDRSRAAQLTE